MNKMKNKKDKSDGKRKRKEISSSDYSSDDDGYKLKGDRRVQYVDLHVPREEINKLCKSLNVDTNGYYVKMEAVLTKRAKH
ncbi:hypothetical protein TRFO_41274 [Tritrichomonas foetus]|uniref:Uncharacterized protein n=1 Tax=Tritrichomonas foetus TaxID=1144522 RepID=A0A1J4L151_9EUKA|nr:hypothetical protein TRFO_41274 [Tritrichomonas foetus]|eukprot:OHT17163.1 hypothetical protein TRFO_41274 [Tritrichomonas foetus]